MSPRESKRAIAGDALRLVMEFAQSHILHAASVLQELGLTPGHLKLLLLLEAGVPRPMGALAQSFACDASTMTWLVDRLEERGLVQRKGLPHDRRVKAVLLTAAGTEVKARAEALLFEPPAALLALDRETLEALRDAFAALRPEARAAPD